ncbi:PREDICTED: uncharacterized protein LOC105366373 [Ceratosolen solmsi marchali]|uniref:Uncharacterized protein LOC105366373 n=1 Tax=Ceratosolen solmsi marchali TaxID=326594 RepID=A0AAJ6YRW9_9HYME|nr:PREDICTED: uncharacterized protein LOC105366373 [Ceratosolen solmsi marchali]
MDISSMLEVEVQEMVDVTPSHTSNHNFPCQIVSKEENDFYQLTYGSDVASIRFLKLHCTACDEHIGSAPIEACNMHQHPVLRTLLCTKCREFYGDGSFEQGDDATDMFCRWCANGGNLYCCSYCSNTFCSKCIKRNLDLPTIKRIEAEDSWKCFVCDIKDLFPLRSLARALLTHIETVTRILKNDNQMSSKDIEEKMHLDETRCCSRKRKRQRQSSLVISSDNDKDDSTYISSDEESNVLPMKKRKVEIVRNIYNNSYLQHKNSCGTNCSSKLKTAIDATDLMIPCEQTMLESNTEDINPNKSYNISELPITQSLVKKKYTRQKQQVQQLQKQQLQQRIQKIAPNNSIAINPVPLTNLLKLTLSSGLKQFKVTHAPNKKLVTVPMPVMPMSETTNSITYEKPTSRFSMSENVLSQPHKKPTVQSSNIINLDSDDEPVILENSVDLHNSNTVTSNSTINSSDNVGSQPVELASKKLTVMKKKSTAINTINNQSKLTNKVNKNFKIHQRHNRFKKTLLLQRQEIDNTVEHLKTKIIKFVQIYNKSIKSNLNQHIIRSAAVCTQRFHQAIQKAVVELSRINDKVMKDYVCWRKKTKIISNNRQLKISKETENNNKEEEYNENKEKSTISVQSALKDDLTLEMICVRDSASESDDEKNKQNNSGNTLTEKNVTTVFSPIVKPITIIKSKLSATKAVGNDSVLMKNKAYQVYDVPWKDYEKCIGYSKLRRLDCNSDKQKEVLPPVVLTNKDFGKYQEQYLFYLQHIEDFGIETDELRGLSKQNHIPLKDLMDRTSPFIVNMLERFSPMTLSNGCISPPLLSETFSITNKPKTPSAPTSLSH